MATIDAPVAARPTAGSIEYEARPLGRGYRYADAFLTGYVDRERTERNFTPDLMYSLRHIERMRDLDLLFSRLSDRPLCLIQGCSTPTNGTALKEFLLRQGIRSPQIDAVDLLDVPAVHAANGMPMPDVNFRVADASSLSEFYRDESVHLIVQDFLLNCIPHAAQHMLLRETARLLHRGGLGIISFTDSSELEKYRAITSAELEAGYGVAFGKACYFVGDKSATLGNLMHTRDPLVVVKADGELTLITRPTGNLEFYRPLEGFRVLLRRAGLKILVASRSCGYDRYGHLCRRHHVVVERSPAARIRTAI